LSPNDEVKKNATERACTKNWGKQKLYRILVAKPERTFNTERLRRRWEDNIKVDLRWDKVVLTGLM
jgi:hypothetical protein